MTAPYTKKNGFALVIALSLLALIILLLLSVSSLVRIEALSGNAYRENLLARENAFLALNVAVGNLQRWAGPDQRVTAPAEVLNGTHISKTKITGIWDSDPDSPTFGETVTWLTSKVDDATFDVTTDAAVADTVELVGAKGVFEPVRAETLDVIGASGVPSGRYAWWVGDEGVKASLALSPHDDSQPDALRTRFSVRHAVELAPGWGDLSKDSDWGKLIKPNDAVFMADLDPTEVADRFHDFTPLAKGVIVDVRNGGLRRDLTVGLSSGSSIIEADTGSDDIFPPQWGGSVQQDPGGPKWSQLRDFYNFRVSGSGAGTIPLREGSDDEVSALPILTWAQVYVHALRANSDGDQVRFYIMPAFALWNPYHHNLSLPELFIGADLTNPRWIATSDVDSPSEQIARSDFPSPLVWRVPGGTLAPGEVRLFSMNSHQEWPVGDVPTLSAGWFSGYGAYRDSPVINEDMSEATTLTPGNNLQLAFEQSSGNSNFYLGFSDTNISDTSFYRVRRWVTWSAANEWREIFASGTIVGPMAGGPPMAAGVHGNPMPRLGYMGSMKFAQEYLNMNWIGYPSENPYLGQYNPRSRYSSRSPSDFLPGSGAGGYNTNPLYTSAFAGGDAHYAQAGNYAVGYSSTLGGGGLPEAAYFEFLREGEPVVGIGMLKHANLERTNNLQPESAGWMHSNIQPAFPIGNSLADPRIPDDSTFVNWNELWSARSGTHYDQSWLLNDALWDRYYFSTVESSLSQAAVNARLPLANPNLVYYQTPSEAELKDYRLSATGLLNSGAFNLNSVSVEAWEAVLGGLLGETANPISGSSNDADTVPFADIFRPLAGNWSGDGESSLRSHSGFRSLTQDEIRQLAEELVVAIRERVSAQGRPFLSIADFINRSLTASDANHRRKGAIQQAIDATNINASLSGGNLSLTMSDTQKHRMAFRDGNVSMPTHYQPDNANGDLLHGIASYLTQADVLARMGHNLSARSDTFLIRTYGTYMDPASGQQRSDVWIEAYLQRVPVPVVVLADNHPDYDASDPDNRISASGNFGRQFELLAYRIYRESAN